MHSEKRSK